MTDSARPTKQAALWMLFLGPFFFIVYNFCNWFTSQRLDVGAMVFEWEKHIPFLPWLILPYMSIDFFFAASVFLCRNKVELNQHVYRIVLAIIISAAGFLLFPLRFSFIVPVVDGFNGLLFQTLFSFDQPFNQAPSLHISLLMILWVKYAQHLKGLWLKCLQIWFALIAISVLGVYQHHVIDIITGFAAGIVCLYAFPEGGWKHRKAHPNRQFAKKYTLGALFLILLAVVLKGLWWSLLWPAVALLLVACAYSGVGASLFQKNAEGRHPWPAKLLLWPFTFGASRSARRYNRHLEAYTMITPNLALGGINASYMQSWDAVLDLTCEFSAKPHPNYLSLPVLDMTVPTSEVVEAALAWLVKQPKEAVICIHCALGLSRSATIVAAWLVHTGQSATAFDAYTMMQQKRPIVWGEQHELVVNQFKKQ